MSEFLFFRKMITPVIIQIIFWIWLALVWLGALAGAIAIMSQGGFAVIVGLFYFVFAGVVGSIVVRVLCELIILGFQIHAELVSMRTGTAPAGPFAGGPVAGFAPVMPPPAPAAPVATAP